MVEYPARYQEAHSPESARAELLERFAAHPFANLETYKYFNQKGEPAREAKDAFIDMALGGETPEAPPFVYPAIDIDELVARRDELTDILQEVLRLDANDESNRLLREKVTDRMHEAGIMLLTKLQSTLDPDDPMYSAISYQLGENMREVYGTPEATHWRGILGYRLSLLAKVEDRDDAPEAVREAWRFVRDSLPTDLPIEKPYKPQVETMNWYRQQLEERLAPARAAVDAAIASGEVVLSEDNKLDSHTIIKATRIALEARGISGWDVLPTDESNIDTSQERQAIFIPITREMTLKQFDAVVQSHEIDEHVIRRVNGDKSGEPILGGTGCAGYLAWEEGNGVANEALLRGKISNEDSAFNIYLSGGLALGLDGRERGRNFGQTFDLVWRMRYIAAFLYGLSDNREYAKREIMDKTVDSLRRIFRGTDGRAPGVVFTKDVMTYYLGQAEVWRKWDGDMALDEQSRKREHELERSAKINPLRPDHHRVAERALAHNAG